MLKIAKAIDKVNEVVGNICAYSIILLTGVVLFEVFSRRVLGTPTVWAFELFIMIFGFHFMMTMPYGLLKRVHVNVDIIYNRLSPRTQAILDVCTFSVFYFPFCIGIFYAAVPFTLQAWVELETSWSVWAPPIYPIKTVIPIAIFLMILQGISEVIKRIHFIRTGEVIE